MGPCGRQYGATLSRAPIHFQIRKSCTRQYVILWVQSLTSFHGGKENSARDQWSFASVLEPGSWVSGVWPYSAIDSKKSCQEAPAITAKGNSLRNGTLAYRLQLLRHYPPRNHRSSPCATKSHRPLTHTLVCTSARRKNGRSRVRDFPSR